MQQLSAPTTRFMKKILPITSPLSMILAAGAVYMASLTNPNDTDLNDIIPFFCPLLIVVGCAMGFFFHKTLAPAMDEVWEDDGTITFKRDGVEERVPVSKIEKIKIKGLGWHYFILKTTTKLGKELMFIPSPAFHQTKDALKKKIEETSSKASFTP